MPPGKQVFYLSNIRYLQNFTLAANGDQEIEKSKLWMPFKFLVFTKKAGANAVLFSRCDRVTM
jgi:hypothetical protein